VGGGVAQFVAGSGTHLLFLWVAALIGAIVGGIFSALVTRDRPQSREQWQGWRAECEVSFSRAFVGVGAARWRRAVATFSERFA